MMLVKGGVNEMTNETERFTLRMPTELKKRLEQRSAELGVSVNALVLQILWDWAEKMG